MSDDDIAALEAEIDAEETGKGKRRPPPTAGARRRPPPPPPRAPLAASSSSSSAALPAADDGLHDDDFDDPYDAIDFKSIAALTAQAAAGGAAGGGDDGDDDLDGDLDVADDVVDADLRALLREIQHERREHGDADSGDGDEDDEGEDELARLEQEHEEEEQKQPLAVAMSVSAPALPPSVPSYPTAAPSPERLLAEQETKRRLQAESVRPSLPAAPPASLSGDAALAALRSSLEGSRRRAREYQRAGKKEEMREVMKSVRTLQARIQIQETQQQTAQTATSASPPSPAASPSSAAAASSFSSPPTEPELQAALKSRLLEYQRAAVFHKQAGRVERAKQLMRDILKMKAAMEAGRALTPADIPQPLDIASQPPRLMRQSSGSKGGGAAPLPTVPPRPPGRPLLPASSPSSSSASAAAAPARPAASGLTTRQSLQYENLIQALTAQASDLRREIAQLMAAAASAKPAAAAAAAASGTSTERTYKLLALQYHRLLKRTQTDLELLRPAMQRGIPPPSFHHMEERLTSIHENADVADDQLVLLLLSSRELSDAVHSITLQWEGVGQPLSYTSAAMKGPTVEWKGRWAVGMGKRTKQTVRAVQRSRLVLLLHRHRRLLGNVEEGRGELRLKELAGRCDKRETVKVKDAEGRRVGEATVEVRLRRPLERMEVKENSRQLLVIDEFEQHDDAAATQRTASNHSPQSSSSAAPPAQSPSPASPPPHSSGSPASASSLAPASVSSTPPPASPHPPLPAGLSEEDVSDPHSVLSIFSNDVLEWEINTRIPSLIALARQRNDAAAVEDCMDRLTSAQTQLQILVTAVQAGRLGLDEYLAKLREGIGKGELQAKELMRRGRKEDAKVVIQRLQLMRQELKTAEDNADELS